MASQAHAARRTTAGRRPAARKRRPAARSGPSRVKWDRIGRIALVLVLAAVLYSYLNPAIDFVKTYTATTAAKAQLHELLHENRRLHNAGPVLRRPDRDRPQGSRAGNGQPEGETPIVVRGLG